MSSSPIITTIIGQRKTLHPVIDGFVFHRSGGSQTLYQCKNKDCKVKVRVHLNMLNQFELIGFIDELNIHLHEKDCIAEILETNEQMSILAKDPALRFEPTTKILQKIDTTKDPRRESTIRREFNRIRNKEIDELRITSHPEFEHYLLFESDLVIVFSNKNKIAQLTKFNYVLMDGTFKSSPPEYQQVYTIHACCLNEHFVLFHCLLKNKSYQIYKELFHVLDSYCKKIGFDLFSEKNTFTIDFEYSVIKALSEYSVIIKGCFFHYNQCLYRRIQMSGFANRYKSDKEFFLYMKRLMMLPLLNQDIIEEVFNELYVDVIKKEDKDILKIYNYFKKVWINGLYKIQMWCCNVEMRTNNITESFHSMFSKRITQHPTAYEYLVKIIEFEKNETKKLTKLKEGKETRRRKVYQKRDSDIAIALRNRERGIIGTNIELLDILGTGMGKKGFERFFEGVGDVNLVDDGDDDGFNLVGDDNNNNVSLVGDDGDGNNVSLVDEDDGDDAIEKSGRRVKEKKCQKRKITTKPNRNNGRRSSLTSRQRVLLQRGMLYPKQTFQSDKN